MAETRDSWKWTGKRERKATKPVAIRSGFGAKSAVFVLENAHYFTAFRNVFESVLLITKELNEIPIPHRGIKNAMIYFLVLPPERQGN